MNPSWKHVALLLGAMVLLFSATTVAARIIKGRALRSHSVHKTSLCHGIDHPKLCTLIARKSRKGGVQKLAQLTIKETMVKAYYASKLAARLQAKLHSKKSMVYQLLGVCRTNFESMSDDLKATMASLKGKSHDPIRNSLSALSTYLETCIDAYDETPHVKSPFGTTIRPMQELVDNLFWMADKLKA